jgi:SRSO17 transposase
MPVQTEPGAAVHDLDAYMADFRGAFRRREQFQWAGTYIQGLLTTPDRKNIANLARNVTPPADLPVEDVFQALQNFVSQSPWDEQRVCQKHWARVAERFGRPDAAFVVEDITFPKQGRQSVGVQRQYSSEADKKINCQIGVSVHYVHTGPPRPLGLRLYLPRTWLADLGRLHAAGVPRRLGVPQSKIQVALELLDAVRAAGLPGRAVLAGAQYAASHAFRDGLAMRGLPYQESEVRPTGDGADVFHQVAETFRRLKDVLGLDHFEGRSWRGFHHHACLVLLAYNFVLEHRPLSFAID